MKSLIYCLQIIFSLQWNPILWDHKKKKKKNFAGRGTNYPMEFFFSSIKAKHYFTSLQIYLSVIELKMINLI